MISRACGNPVNSDSSSVDPDQLTSSENTIYTIFKSN